MYVRRKVYSYSEPEEQLYSVTMTEEEIDLFSEFMDGFYETLYSDGLSNDEKVAAAAGALGATTAAGYGAYRGHKAIKANGGYKKSAEDAWEYTKGKASATKEYAKEKGSKAWEATKGAGRYVKEKSGKAVEGTKALWKSGKGGRAAVIGGGVALGAGAYGAGKAIYNKTKKD